ncbi:carbonic anhydrase 4b [Notolabrus celidotus]|uniref:carbonic anhydrase 4b n=1 Tax=Notolabrus celidotus TaxID=1203425 RepID=UPI00148FFEB5|nr:carbonic anhydrase 4b [Notolabrus celidotus]
MLLILVLLLFASSMEIASGSDWCYNDQDVCGHTCTGPDIWGAVSRHCSGTSQSPVNIVTRKVLPDGRLTPFHFSGYQEAFHGRLINNGHTVHLDLPSSLRIRGGNLFGSYKAVQAHLHWGKDGGPGSEHTIDGEQFSMEMHVVHIKEEYETVSQALRDHTGVAVLGFFFQESESANKKFDPLINSLKYVTRSSNSTTLRGVSLEMLLPAWTDMTKYYRYYGSLTTPSCAEAVIWSLFENPIPLSRKQLAAFSKLQFSNGKQMIRTYRPIQPLNGRPVYYSRGHVGVVSTLLLVISVIGSSLLSLHTTG